MRIRFGGLNLLAAACLLGVFPARAVPITYIVQTTASGTLNGVAFTNAGLTVTLSGDTSGIVSLNPATQDFSLGNPGAATLVISGLGAAAFTDQMAAVSTLNTPLMAPTPRELWTQLKVLWWLSPRRRATIWPAR